MDLEQLIDEAYTAYKAAVEEQKQQEELKQQQQIEAAIATLKSHLDKALAPEVQEALGMELFAEVNEAALASFSYQGHKTYLEYGPFRDGTEWKVWIDDEENSCRTKSENLQRDILIGLGQIRELTKQLPVMLSPLEQILNVAHCLEESLDSQEHQGRIDEITASAKQLIEMIRLHGQGELKPVVAATVHQPF